MSQERDRLGLKMDEQFAYGEVIPMYYMPLLSLCEPKPGEVLYDLGCGAGKPLVYAALAAP